MKYGKRNLLKSILAFSMAFLMFLTVMPTTLYAEDTEETGLLVDITTTNGATCDVLPLADGEKIVRTSGTTDVFEGLPEYLVGKYFIRKNNFNVLTATAKEDCFVYVLASAPLVSALETDGFTHVESLAKASILGDGGYYLGQEAYMSSTLYLMEKQVKTGELITYGNGTCWAILITSKNQIEIPEALLVDVTVANGATCDILPLADGEKIIRTSGTVDVFEGLPAYLTGKYFIQKNNFNALTATVKVGGYAYVLASEPLVTAMEADGFIHVQSMAKADILGDGGYYLGQEALMSSTLYLMEKQVKRGDTITYGNGNCWAILLTSRTQLVLPEELLADITTTNGATCDVLPLADGEKIIRTSGTVDVFEGLPDYLVGKYFIRKNNFNVLTATVKVGCYAYVLASEPLVATLETNGFIHVQSLSKSGILGDGGYYLGQESYMSSTLYLMEKQVKRGDTITYGNGNCWATLITSRTQLVLPEELLVGITTTNGATCDVLPLADGEKIVRTSGATDLFEGLPKYLVGKYFIRKNNFNALTATVKVGCYAYVLASEPLVEALKSGGFTHVVSLAKKDILGDGGYYLGQETYMSSTLYLMEKQVQRGETITYGNGSCWAILLTSRTKLQIPTVLLGNTVTLDGQIGINYYMALNDELSKDTSRVKMHFTLPNATAPIVVDECVYNETKDAYVFTCELPAKHMAETVVAQAYVDGVACYDTYEVSVKEYADTLLNDSTQAETVKELVKAMLHYGAYSQVYFNYHTDALANAGLEALDLTTVTQADFEKDIITAVTDFGEIKASNLGLTAETYMNLYLQLEEGINAADYTFTCDGVELEKGEYNGLLTVKVANIAADELDTVFTIEATKTGEAESSATFTYSAFSYAYKVMDENYTGRAGIKDLMKAMYKYNEAANAVSGNS